jgi:hypothetical protein
MKEGAMNLHEFIREALVEIISGVADARTAAAEHGALVGSDKVYGPTSAAMILRTTVLLKQTFATHYESCRQSTVSAAIPCRC